MDGPLVDKEKKRVQFRENISIFIRQVTKQRAPLNSIEEACVGSSRRRMPQNNLVYKQRNVFPDSRSCSSQLGQFKTTTHSLSNGNAKRPQSAQLPRLSCKRTVVRPSSARPKTRPLSGLSKTNEQPSIKTSFSGWVRPIKQAAYGQPICQAMSERPVDTSVTISSATSESRQDWFSSRQVSVPSTNTVCTEEHRPTSIMDTADPDNISSSDRPGVTVWRYGKQKLQIVEEAKHGFFHEGDCYMILWVDPREMIRRTVHCWIGQMVTKKDSDKVERTAAEQFLNNGNVNMFTRETQGRESSCFLRLFPDGICYLEESSCPTIRRASRYCKCLYQITGGKYPRAWSMHPYREMLDSKSTYLLDKFPRMYLWMGKHCDYATKVKAMELSRRFRDFQRNGRAFIVVVDETDVKSHNLLLRKLQTACPCTDLTNHAVGGGVAGKGPLTEGEWLPEDNPVLYRLSGDNNIDDISEVARISLRGEFLSSKNLYIVDSGSRSPLTVWVGQRVTSEEMGGVIDTAKAFSERRGYNHSLSLVCVRENEEPILFTRSFVSWRGQKIQPNVLRKSYTVGSVEKVLFSRRDNRPVAKTEISWPDEALHDPDGILKIWRVDEKELALLPVKQHGVFFTGNCYLVLHSPTDPRPPVLYYWMGNKTNEDEREHTMLAVWKLDDSELKNAAVLIRVMDGEEPGHFLDLIQGTMLVYKGREGSADEEVAPREMFSVQSVQNNAIRVSQVSVRTDCLSSEKAFLIITEKGCHIWYGKDSGGYEREYTKTLLEFLSPDRMYDFRVEVEGKESSLFWSVLDGNPSTKAILTTKKLQRRDPRLIHYLPELCKFQEIPEFLQEDLSEDGVFLLDLFDQVWVWLGHNIDTQTRQQLSNLTTIYMQQDPAGRCLNNVQLWVVKQSHEPEAFIRCFHCWDTAVHMGRARVDKTRNMIQQENAALYIDGIATAPLSPLQKVAHKVLARTRERAGWDNTHKERHLSSTEFQERLRVGRSVFYEFPVWKQKQIRRAAKLIPE